MAYKMSFSGVNTKEVLRFSSPDYECAPSMPCGIPVGEPGEANAVKVLKKTTPIIEKLH
jgi:hypothetical protein